MVTTEAFTNRHTGVQQIDLDGHKFSFPRENRRRPQPTSRGGAGGQHIQMKCIRRRCVLAHTSLSASGSRKARWNSGSCRDQLYSPAGRQRSWPANSMTSGIPGCFHPAASLRRDAGTEFGQYISGVAERGCGYHIFQVSAGGMSRNSWNARTLVVSRSHIRHQYCPTSISQPHLARLGGRCAGVGTRITHMDERSFWVTHDSLVGLAVQLFVTSYTRCERDMTISQLPSERPARSADRSAPAVIIDSPDPHALSRLVVLDWVSRPNYFVQAQRLRRSRNSSTLKGAKPIDGFSFTLNPTTEARGLLVGTCRPATVSEKAIASKTPARPKPRVRRSYHL